eukprot:756535-Hanusia_phi.AAC.4
MHAPADHAKFPLRQQPSSLSLLDISANENDTDLIRVVYDTDLIILILRRTKPGSWSGQKCWQAPLCGNSWCPHESLILVVKDRIYCVSLCCSRQHVCFNFFDRICASYMKMKKWIRDSGQSFLSALSGHKGRDQDDDDCEIQDQESYPFNSSRLVDSHSKKMTAASRVLVPSTPTKTKAQFEDYLNQNAVSVLEGDLMKRKGRGIGKAWVRQHFVLRKDALYYGPCTGFTYKEKKITLSRENAFGVLDTSSKSLHVMYAESEKSMIEWVKTLIAVQIALENRYTPHKTARPRSALHQGSNSKYREIPSLPNFLKTTKETQNDYQDGIQGHDTKASTSSDVLHRSADHLTDSSEEEHSPLKPEYKNVIREDLEGLQKALLERNLSKAYALIDEGANPAFLDFGSFPTIFYENELKAMKKIGFLDERRNCLVLLQCKGKLDAAIIKLSREK